MNKYSYDFVRSHALSGRTYESASGGGYWLNDRVVLTTFGRATGVHGGDLISVALACYVADRLGYRGRPWRRDISVRVSVVDPEPWEAARDPLERFLHVLTDDDWHVSVTSGRVPRIAESQQTLFPKAFPPNSAIALFSGGLDSLAGAVSDLVQDPASHLVLLSSRSSTVIGATQRRLADGLRERFPQRLTGIQVPLHLRNARSVESTQRTRSFVFMALAAAAAIAGEIGSVRIYENGIGAYNPRLLMSQTGCQATLGTHPYVLDRFIDLLRAVGIHNVSIELPNRLRTKAEVVARLPSRELPLVGLTASCDGYPLREAHARQCGRCGSCVLRMQSLIATGLERSDRTDYRVTPLLDGVGVDAVCQLGAHQARAMHRLAAPEHWPEILQRWPSLGLGLTDPDSLEGTAILRMLQRYGEEWEVVMRRRVVHAAFRWADESAESAA